MNKNSEMKVTEEKKDNMYSRLLHHTMAVVGGIFGIYTILIRGNMLGNAQTSNMIQLVLCIFGNNWKEVLIRFTGIVIFMLSCMTFVILKNKTKIRLKQLSILLDVTAVFVCMLIPVECNNIIALYPVFAVMPIQWNVFAGCFGYASATLFSTNNIRQLSLSIGEYLCERDSKHLKKTGFFAGSLAGFYLGVAIGYVSTMHLEIYGIAVALIFLVAAAVLCRLEQIKS